MILYEYPLNERIRTFLRLEHLFTRLRHLITEESSVSHHFSLATIFEIMDVCGRADLKTEVMKDIERQRQLLKGFRGNPAISEVILDQVIRQLDSCYDNLSIIQGKVGQNLAENDWLMSIRSRIAIPGGTCEFDLPAYYFWLQKSSASRQTQLANWARSLFPMESAIKLLLHMLRESGAPQKVIATNGVFQQNLPLGRTCQLLRVAVNPSYDLIPEISGNRLMFSIRFLQLLQDGRLQARSDSTPVELTLCS